MEEVIKEITMFYGTLEWLNMRSNSCDKMILGTSRLEYMPFIKKINNSGVNNLIKNISDSYIDLKKIDRVL